MKKIICLSMCILLSLLAFVGCSQATVPNTTAMWGNNETIHYTVRKASKAELIYSEVSATMQRIPDDVTGTYATTITKGESTYTLSTEYVVTETYNFNAGDKLLEKAKAIADSYDFITVDGNTVTVNVSIYGTCVFNTNDFLPQNSSKQIKSVVFINETTVNKKTYECQCSVNDVNTVVTYDYSAKKPKATVKTNGTEEVVTLAKTTKTKTYDNEQLGFLLRSFKWNDLVSNGNTTISVFDGLGSASALSVVAKASSKGEFDYYIGGVWETALSSYEFTYYKDGENYVDLKNNVVEVTKRKVAEVGVSTGGIPILYYFDHETASSTSTYKMVRMQQGYVICDVTDPSALDS